MTTPYVGFGTKISLLRQLFRHLKLPASGSYFIHCSRQKVDDYVGGKKVVWPLLYNIYDNCRDIRSSGFCSNHGNRNASEPICASRRPITIKSICYGGCNWILKVSVQDIRLSGSLPDITSQKKASHEATLLLHSSRIDPLEDLAKDAIECSSKRATRHAQADSQNIKWKTRRLWRRFMTWSLKKCPSLSLVLPWNGQFSY